MFVSKNESRLSLFGKDLSKAENLLSGKNMNIEFVASTHIEKTIIVANKLVEKSPIGSVVVRNASVLDPKVILNLTNESFINKMQHLITHIITLSWIDSQYGYKVILQYRLFLENEKKIIRRL